jgi:hypothetical protein
LRGSAVVVVFTITVGCGIQESESGLESEELLFRGVVVAGPSVGIKLSVGVDDVDFCNAGYVEELSEDGYELYNKK